MRNEVQRTTMPVKHFKLATVSVVWIIGLLAITLSGAAMAESLNRLQPCPNSPNCVCSDASDRHGIEPIATNGDPQTTWRHLQDYLNAQPDIKITIAQPDYLKVEAKTRLLRFVDDVEFELRAEAGIIAVRSASRVGYSDLGANRRRIEKIRRALSRLN
tara:strand:- start:213 stop:689 length:477 start_codon:yes stop_codon:yes gene_type:complete